ncbi:MAG: GrlR family regulatory protein [Oceanicaulis sp.]
MDTGLYIARFRTPLDDAAGVIYVDGDQVYGGDTAMYYVGKITGEDGKISVSLRVRQHDRDRMSVFGEVEDFTLTLTGRKTGDEYAFEGRADRAPSLRFQAVLKKAPL